MTDTTALPQLRQQLTCDVLAVTVQLNHAIDVLTTGHALAVANDNLHAAADLHTAQQHLHQAREHLLRFADRLTVHS